MFEFIEENLDDIYSFKKFACEYIAENNCRIKYNVVMKDEREAGTSRNLKSGPHSRSGNRDSQRLQAATRRGTGDWNGSTGTHVSTLGYMSEEQAERVIKLYERAGLPTRIPDYIDREELDKEALHRTKR